MAPEAVLNLKAPNELTGSSIWRSHGAPPRPLLRICERHTTCYAKRSQMHSLWARVLTLSFAQCNQVSAPGLDDVGQIGAIFLRESHGTLIWNEVEKTN